MTDDDPRLDEAPAVSDDGRSLDTVDGIPENISRRTGGDGGVVGASELGRKKKKSEAEMNRELTDGIDDLFETIKNRYYYPFHKSTCLSFIIIFIATSTD